MLMTTTAAYAQVEILGLRTYAEEDEYRPPVITGSERVTIEFDVATSLPPNLQIVFRHASKDWVPDNNVFVNDPPKLRSDVLLYSPAPAGVYYYTYRYKNSFPNDRNFVAFEHSGNYLYSIIDRDNNDRVVATGKFILVQSLFPVGMTIVNRYHPEYASPLNQMNFIAVAFTAPAEYTAADFNSIHHPDITQVRIIKNWLFENPEVIDVADYDDDTFVEHLTKPDKIFWKRDVAVGNEYRRIDLSSTSLYPNSALAVLRDGPDLSRMHWQSGSDANGASKLKAFVGSNSDYLEVEMRLRLASDPDKQIFLVGSFTGWKVLAEYEMKKDTITGLYTFRHWLRRGVYDYQYVLGDVTPSGDILHQDWISLEGNDWRTIHRYTALVYYHDQRLGGFDRIIGYVRSRNPGTHEPDASISTTYPPGLSTKTVDILPWKK